MLKGNGFDNVSMFNKPGCDTAYCIRSYESVWEQELEKTIQLELLESFSFDRPH